MAITTPTNGSLADASAVAQLITNPTTVAGGWSAMSGGQTNGLVVPKTNGTNWWYAFPDGDGSRALVSGAQPKAICVEFLAQTSAPTVWGWFWVNNAGATRPDLNCVLDVQQMSGWTNDWNGTLSEPAVYLAALQTVASGNNNRFACGPIVIAPAGMTITPGNWYRVIFRAKYATDPSGITPLANILEARLVVAPGS